MELLSPENGTSTAAKGALPAFVLGYVVTYATTVSAVRESVASRVAIGLGESAPAWKMVGWVYYNAHGVRTRIDVGVPVFGDETVVDLIIQIRPLSGFLYLLPPLLLIIVGVFAVRSALETRPSDVLLISLALGIGYFPLATLGAVLFTIQTGTAVGKPVLAASVFRAGVLYPVVFGFMGAGMAKVRASQK